jgi:sugar lactone lactonase YvrE
MVLISAILFIPGLPPKIRYESYKITPAKKLEGKLAPNSVLDKAELAYDGKLVGPESIAIRGKEIYTGVGGKVIRIKDGEIKTIAQFGPKHCDEGNYWEVETCGRPLGMRFDNKGKLIVADAYLGIFRVDVDTGKFELLVNADNPINGKEPLLIDDIDVADDDTIYFSDGSTVSELYNFVTEFLGTSTGRLLKYTPVTNISEVLLDKLHFANGVQLSKNDEFVMVCETARSRVVRYYLKGPKAGKHDILIEGLPGLPDNIRPSKNGYYVSLVVFRDDLHPSLGDIFGPLPLIRKLILRLQGLLNLFVSSVEKLVPLSIVSKAKHYVGNLALSTSVSKKVLVVEIDENGNVIGSLQTENGKMAFITEVSVGEEYTYFASFFESKLWRIKTSDLHDATST